MGTLSRSLYNYTHPCQSPYLLLEARTLPREYPPRFACFLAHHCQLLKATAHGQPEVPEVLPSAVETFVSMQYGSQDDMFSFAALQEVFVYVRGGKRLVVPPEWKDLEKLLLAARSRLNRMMKVHKKKKELEAPEYARKHWEGNKNEMTLLLRDCNFSKDLGDMFLEKLERIVKKKEKYTLKVDEGWYSASEMKTELGWHIKVLNDFVEKMEAEHERSQVVYSEGEVSGFDASFNAKAEQQMKTATFVYGSQLLRITYGFALRYIQTR
ncbi:unnamed protein product [Symbiodinium sp. CCMP2592]|nr:unnamed protein product [Symbiodinium sp. CCMP2592]CAE7621560.1 unnamed protein product [Symbiodinium sp. CCMP2592]CAE7746809.1 unnamed protein product [Symbiodinium sp. CCMP2592]